MHRGRSGRLLVPIFDQSGQRVAVYSSPSTFPLPRSTTWRGLVCRLEGDRYVVEGNVREQVEQALLGALDEKQRALAADCGIDFSINPNAFSRLQLRLRAREEARLLFTQEPCP